jgi:hypothetical protein
MKANKLFLKRKLDERRTEVKESEEMVEKGGKLRKVERR